MNNTLHINRRIRSSFGVTKIPFTLAQPVDADPADHNPMLEPMTREEYVAQLLKPVGVVARIKFCTPVTGWAHFSKLNA